MYYVYPKPRKDLQFNLNVISCLSGKKITSYYTCFSTEHRLLCNFIFYPLSCDFSCSSPLFIKTRFCTMPSYGACHLQHLRQFTFSNSQLNNRFPGPYVYIPSEIEMLYIPFFFFISNQKQNTKNILTCRFPFFMLSNKTKQKIKYEKRKWNNSTAFCYSQIVSNVKMQQDIL